MQRTTTASFSTGPSPQLFIMHILLVNALITALSLTSPVLAQGHPRFPGDPDYCTQPYTYDFVDHLQKAVFSKYHNVTLPSSHGGGTERCCDLCHHSTKNCMAAQYDPDTEICQIYVTPKLKKKDAKKWLTPAEPDSPAQPNLTAQCPLGVSKYGFYDGSESRQGHFLIGPCWTRRDILPWE